MGITYRKRTRLKEFDYRGHQRYFITVCTFHKEHVFTNNPSSVIELIGLLREKSRSLGFKVWAYCFMPDHLHLLVEGNDIDSDLKKFISSFKQVSGYRYKEKMDKQLWQVSYYDHVLRKAEDSLAVAQYIFNNPVRKGLVDDFKKYEYLGSFEFDVDKL
jgi:putative transposase